MAERIVAHFDMFGSSAQGTLNITNSGTVTQYSYRNDAAYIGQGSFATVDGAGSTWTCNGNLYVGSSYGNGTLNITNGGAVSSYGGNIGENGGTGAVTVDGVAAPGVRSTLTIGNGNFYIGDGGNGTLNITNGGAVACGGIGYIGSSSGNGTLAVVSGSGLTTGKAYIGYGAGTTGTATVDGANSTWTNTGSIGGIFVGDYGTGTLNITNGGSVNTTGYLYVARQVNSTGTVNISGGGSVSVNGLAAVGIYGNGTLNITNGGALSCTGSGGAALVGWEAGASGTVNVDGTSSTCTTYDASAAGGGEFNVGYLNGTGNLNITNGGAVSSGNGFVGRGAGSVGTAIVDSGGQWNTNGYDFNVGFYGGSGTLSITNGGTVTSGNGFIGDASGYTDGPTTATATVDGHGSTWTTYTPSAAGGGEFNVGDSGGTGTLNITNGGAISSGNGFVGRGAGSVGTATVDSGGQWNTNGYDMNVGFYGASGTLNITNGGTVTSGNGHIGWPCGYTGSSPTTGMVTVDGKGSTWTNSGSLDVGYGGSGTLNITNGGQVNVASTLTLWETDSSVTVNRGTLSVGGLAGTGALFISDPAGGAAALVVGSTADSTFLGTIADSTGGAGSLLKIGSGMLTLGGANSYSGSTTVSEGVLAMGADDSLSTKSNLVLDGGTTLKTYGYSQNAGTGALAILGDAMIDVGSPGSILKFADSSAEAWSGTLTILDWEGSLSGGGADELFFGSSASALTSGQLSEIIFENPDGLTGNYEATILPTGEIVPVPVPEPSTFVLLGIGAISLLAYAWRRRTMAMAS